MKKIRLVLSICLLLVLIWNLYEQSHSQTTSTPTNVSINDTSGSPSTASTTKAGPLSLYPDPRLTPGAVLTTDAATVCTPGYSASVRNVSTSVKRQVFTEYGLAYPVPTGTYEADHFISLELGGSNDITNLWPEPADPRPGFHEKDVVENYLHAQVCKGTMTLTEAQQEMDTDWYAVYLKIK